jgi:hypothetical protein
VHFISQWSADFELTSGYWAVVIGHPSSQRTLRHKGIDGQTFGDSDHTVIGMPVWHPVSLIRPLNL